MKSRPVTVEESEVPGTHDISLQDLQAPGPVQVIVCIVQVQIYCVGGRFPHGRNLLKHSDLKGCGPHAASRPEPMEGVVLGNGGSETAIGYHRHRLPHHLHETYATVVSPPFHY